MVPVVAGSIIGPPLVVLAQNPGHVTRSVNGSSLAPTGTPACQAPGQPAPAPRGPEWQRIDQAIETLRAAYARRGTGETFEQAAQRVAAAQQGQINEMSTSAMSEVTSTASFDNAVVGSEVVAAGSQQNLSRSQLNRQQREGLVAGTVGALGVVVRVSSASDVTAVTFSRNVIETLSREAGLDPALAERAREQANSAVDLVEYRNQEAQRNVSRAEERIEQTDAIAEATTTIERAGGFRDDNSTDPFSIQVGDIFLQIDADGSIRYTGPDPTRRGTQRTSRDALGNLRVRDDDELVSVATGPGRGSMPSAASIERTRAYLRSMGAEGEAALRAFDLELDRIQRRAEAAARRGGGGSAGGGAGGGNASGFVDTPDDWDPVEAEFTEIELAAQVLARGGLRLPEGDAGPPVIIHRFMAGGAVLQVIALAEIYTSYRLQDGPLIVRSGPSSVGSGPSGIMITPSSAGRSLSSVGTSMSSMGRSLSAAGTSPSSVGTSLSSVATTPSAVWWSGSAAGLNTGSLVWTSPNFWSASGISSASDWTDPNRRNASQPAGRRPSSEIPQELCGR